MSNIWIFGCSFSSGYLEVPSIASYGGLLSKELGLNLNNIARPGNDNDKIFYDLASNLDKIEENDIIVTNSLPLTEWAFLIPNTSLVRAFQS